MTTLEVKESLNPAQYFWQTKRYLNTWLFRNCAIQEDLAEHALLEGEKIYVDGSSKCVLKKKNTWGCEDEDC